MAKRVHANLLCSKRWARSSRCPCVLHDKLADRIAAERLPARTGEDRFVQLSATFVEPRAQDRHGVAGERDSPLLAALADDSDVRAALDDKIGVTDRGQLRHPQAGLDGEAEKRMITSSAPAL